MSEIRNRFDRADSGKLTRVAAAPGVVPTSGAPRAAETPSPIAGVRASDRRRFALLALAFLLATSLPTVRVIRQLNVPGHPELPYYALQDFRDAIYYPVIALLDGNNPYDPQQFFARYPVGQEFPLYSPLTLAVHMPFGLLPLPAAEWAYYVVSVALLPLVVWLALRTCNAPETATNVFGIAVLLVLSHPGEWNLFCGQSTLELVLGVLLALHYPRSRPLLAGLGFALSTLKPTYGLPLAVVMLARRDVRALAIGLGVSAILTVAPAAVIFTHVHGVAGLLATVRENHQMFAASRSVDPMFTVSRIDTVALAERLWGEPFSPIGSVVTTAIILGAAAFALSRVARDDSPDARHYSASLACVTIVACVYHQTYDALILIFPFIALVRWAGARPVRDLPYVLRILLAGLLAVPALNYFASYWGMRLLSGCEPGRLVVLSLNGAAVLTAFLLYVGAAMCPSLSRESPPPTRLGEWR